MSTYDPIPKSKVPPAPRKQSNTGVMHTEERNGTMKLNPDCVRDVLLYLEENLVYTDEKDVTAYKPIEWAVIYDDPELRKKYSEIDIKYSIQKLYEADYIVADLEPNRDWWEYCSIYDIK